VNFLPNQVVLNFDDALLTRLDAEKERIGATRSGTVVHILKKHFAEQQEQQQAYDKWFVTEVKRGLSSLETEPLHDHEDVMREVHELLENKRMNHAPEMV